MKRILPALVAETIVNRRKEKGYSQTQLSDLTGINRSMIGRAEKAEYMPTVDQLQSLGEVLGFEVVDPDYSYFFGHTLQNRIKHLKIK